MVLRILWKKPTWEEIFPWTDRTKGNAGRGVDRDWWGGGGDGEIMEKIPNLSYDWNDSAIFEKS